MENTCKHFFVLLVGIILTTVLSLLCHQSIVSNWERVNNAQYDVIGGSIVSTITMNDRWTQFSKILGSNPNITGTKFSEILSGLVETYNDGVFVTRKFQDNRDFFQYLTPRYTNDQIATVRSNPSINITNSSYPIVYAYPTDMGLIGYDTGMIQSVRDAIGYMKATGEPVFVKFPKGAINFDTETIIYGTPISIDDQEDSFAAIRLSVVGSLVREMNLEGYLETTDISIFIILQKETITSIFSSSDETNTEHTYVYESIWSSNTDIRVVFSDTRTPNIWFVYAVAVVGLIMSLFVTYVDVRYEQKEKLAKKQSKFIGTFSHELLTPINGIIGTADAIEYTPGIHESVFQNIVTLRSCTTHLMNLVKNVLALYHIQSKEVEVNQTLFNISTIEEHIKQTWNKAMKNDKVKLKIFYQNLPREGELMGDEGKIRHIIYNVLDNAVKFTEEGYVHIKIRWEEMDPHEDYGNTKITMTITDTGVGIPSDCTGQIFQPFVSLRNNKTEQGVGIGLAVSRSLATAMGGTLNFNSIDGKGSEFIFVFYAFGSFTHGQPSEIEEMINVEPQKSIDTIETDDCYSTEDEEKTEIKHRSALIVDDISINIKILKRIVQKQIDHCDTSSSGTEAVELCRKHRYDVIFMDKSMPICDGIQATRKIREEGMNKDTCIIFVTADTTEASENECILAGGTEYITKPIVSSRIENIIKKYIYDE